MTYTIAPDPATGKTRVDLQWDTQNRVISAIGVSPRWMGIERVPELLEDVAIEGGAVKREASRWIIEHKKGATLRFSYVVNPGRKAIDWKSTGYPVATPDFFHGFGNAFLLTPEPGGDVPSTYTALLRWKLPSEWKAVCSWGAGKSVATMIDAADLRHSAYVAGKLSVKESAAGGRPVTVAMLNKFGFETDDFVQLATKIIAKECEFMRDTTFPAFVITVVPVGDAVSENGSQLSGSGLYNSFAMFMAPENKLNDAVEHLFAHELFHYWNGRVLGAASPEGLVMWFTEGLTDYYARRILFESGIWNAATYSKWTNRQIRQYVWNPAANASNEKIKEQFWRERDTVGEAAYQRGMMLGLRWHKLARDHGVKDGLDALLHALLDRARQEKFELSNEGIRRIGREVLGEWFAAEFDQHVARAETVEVPLDALVPALHGKQSRAYEFDLGFHQDKTLKARKVIGLKPGSAAEKAGLREGDELAGWDVYTDADQETTLTIRRDGKVKKISFYPRGESRGAVQFAPAASAPQTEKKPRKP
ncbi:MAG: hypothetical protein JNG88_04050 [Phycisphaerales bacterium]|nr:hypothetical protein [Phycisphaerales bacterium]